MSSIRIIKHNYGEIRHYHGEIRPLVGGMSMRLKKAFRKRDYGFGEYLPIEPQPDHINSGGLSDQPYGYRYDYF